MKLRLLQHRISDPEYSLVKSAAYAAGVSISEYVRAATMARATKPCPLCKGSGRRPKAEV